MDFLEFWICYSALNFTQNNTYKSHIYHIFGYMVAFDYWTIVNNNYLHLEILIAQYSSLYIGEIQTRFSMSSFKSIIL